MFFIVFVNIFFLIIHFNTFFFFSYNWYIIFDMIFYKQLVIDIL